MFAMAPASQKRDQHSSEGHPEQESTDRVLTFTKTHGTSTRKPFPSSAVLLHSEFSTYDARPCSPTSVRLQEHPCCKTGSVISCPALSKQVNMDHIRIDRDSPRSPAFPPDVAVTWHFTNSRCFVPSPKLLERLLLSLPRSPPGDSQM